MAQDSWGRTLEYVRLSLTEACNFACPYCRSEIIPYTPSPVSVDDWMQILDAFQGLGVKAIRLTGGEPLLYEPLLELLERIRKSGWFEDISMTTNGSLLAEKARDLRAAGLQRLNISLDSLDAIDFKGYTGGYGDLDTVIGGIEAALAAGFKSIKMNTVLSRTFRDEEVKTLLGYMNRWDVVWRFIEYMPFNGKKMNIPTFDEWQSQIERVSGQRLVLNETKRGFGPASYYRLGHKVLGFIFPMSHSYCHACNRVRLTADGHLRLCLLKDGEVDLLTPLRLGAKVEDMREIINHALYTKGESHDGDHIDHLDRHMWRIGG